mgnify:CR=1 FL=1|tara:strand:- start:24 stop:575 length:552 start_codon:yes stop_codon:yes gene_type:complete
MTDQIYYETMYILRPDIAEDEVSNHIEKYNKLLKKLGGKLLDSQMRGKRRLAYQISKHREGIYVQLSHQGDGQHISKIEKAMRLSEDVIRYLTVKQEGPLPTPKSSNISSNQSDKKENENIDLTNKSETKSDETQDKKSDTAADQINDIKTEASAAKSPEINENTKTEALAAKSPEINENTKS